MIAICQPAPAEWSAGPPVAERTGSLRRIDDILSELLAGYVPAVQTDAAIATRPDYAGLPGMAVDGAQVHAAPAELLSVCQH